MGSVSGRTKSRSQKVTDWSDGYENESPEYYISDMILRDIFTFKFPRTELTPRTNGACFIIMRQTNTYCLFSSIDFQLLSAKNM